MAGHQDPGARGVLVTKAALAELLAQLRRAAVGGVVPEAVFLAQTRKLGLREHERERLRDELVRLHVPVQRSVVHAHVDIPDVQKVVRKHVEIVFPQLDRVLRLLERYADAEGRVTSRTLEGVVRLCGLNAREAAALRDAANVGPERTPTDSTAEAAPEEDRGDVDEEPATVGDAKVGGEGSSALEQQEPQVSEGSRMEELDVTSAEGFPSGPSETVVPTDADLAAAVAAAERVMREDRYRCRPEKQLLTAREEVGLAMLVRGGLDEEPDQETLSAVPSDDIRIRARDCLVVHNQGLVHSLVPRYLEQGLDYEDLFQHGALGLMRAARKFDPTKGFKFSTYATWWIRQSITRGIADEGSVIRVPVHMHETIRKVANAERSLAERGRPATAADVAVYCDLSLSKVEEARRLSRRTDSLDRVVGDGVTLGDFVAQTHTLPPFEERVHNALLLDDAMAVVNTFSGRDHRILVRRLGLDDAEPSTLDQLGSEFGVTRERIRQLEVKLVPALRSRLQTARLLGVRAVVAAEDPGSADSVRTVATGRRAARAERTVRPVPVKKKAIVASTMPSRSQDTTVAPSTSQEADTPAVVASADAQDWDRARRLAESPSGQAWLADYAIAAVGGPGLTEMLGQPAAETVRRIAREREPADHSVLAALEVLRRVCDGVAQAGMRPEDFFDRPSEALCGVTPRAYLARKPLVRSEPRLAMRDALREFLAFTKALPEASAAESAEDVPARPEPREQTPPPHEPTEPASAPHEQTEPAPAEKLSDESEPVPGALPYEELVNITDDSDEEAAAESGTNHPTSSDAAATDLPAMLPQYTADWDRARQLTPAPFGGKVAWLAEYALRAVGHLQLAVMLGSSPADAVVRAVRERSMLNRPTILALETLEGVLDVVKELELRPEHYFEWTSEALGGTTPRAFLSAKPLVDNESRLAIHEALREFKAAQAQRNETGQDDAEQDTEAGTPREPLVDVEHLLTEARARHEAELARLADTYESRLAEERQAADARVTALQAEAGQQLDDLEGILLNRVDKALARQEQHLRRQAEERIARLKEEHREANMATTRRAQERIVDLEIRLRQAETTTSTVASEQVSRLQAHAEQAEKQLHQYREEAVARVADLESRLRQTETRLRQTETRLIARDRAMYEAGQRAAADVEQAQQRAEAAEQRAQALVTAANQAEARAVQGEQLAAGRLAQAEHDARARITELQTELAALQAPAAGRATLMDRWRRT
ncbi:sigma-70 family RNA polymerase sigma factor [Streptomyces sp. 900105755]